MRNKFHFGLRLRGQDTFILWLTGGYILISKCCGLDWSTVGPSCEDQLLIYLEQQGGGPNGGPLRYTHTNTFYTQPPFHQLLTNVKLIKSQRSLQFKLYSHWSSLESVLAMWQKKLIYYHGKTTVKSWFRWVKCYSMATLLTAALLQVSYQIFPYCYHIIFTVEVLPTREIIVMITMEHFSPQSCMNNYIILCACCYISINITQ